MPKETVKRNTQQEMHKQTWVRQNKAVLDQLLENFLVSKCFDQWLLTKKSPKLDGFQLLKLHKTYFKYSISIIGLKSWTNYEKFLLQVKRNSVKSKRELITGNKNRDDHILRTVKLKKKKYQNVNELTKSLNCWCSLI